jgi:hypothetical protein
MVGGREELAECQATLEEALLFITAQRIQDRDATR